MTLKRGRKKGSKNKHSGEPHGYAFWKETLKKQETVNAFLERGSKQQKETIKEIVTYLKRHDPDYFERINGEEILKEIG
jgi:hypothetical protein